MTAVEFAVPAENSRVTGRYVIEALGTFLLLSTVGIALSTANPLAALGIGAVLMAMIYAGGHRVSGHYNPAVTMAALVRGRILLNEAAAYWCAQIAAGLGAAMVLRVIAGPGQIENPTAMMLGGRTLVAALAAELLFTFVLSYVVISCVSRDSVSSNTLSELAIGVAVVAGTVDIGALCGDVYLVSQVVAGAFAGIAFLTFGVAGL
jgi:aquaporin Z